MIETSSDLIRSSLAIFGNLRKMFGNVREAFGTIYMRTIYTWCEHSKINSISPRVHVLFPISNALWPMLHEGTIDIFTVLCFFRRKQIWDWWWPVRVHHWKFYTAHAQSSHIQLPTQTPALSLPTEPSREWNLEPSRCGSVKITAKAYRHPLHRSWMTFNAFNVRLKG